jgi:hypothetical protein
LLNPQAGEVFAAAGHYFVTGYPAVLLVGLSAAILKTELEPGLPLKSII